MERKIISKPLKHLVFLVIICSLFLANSTVNLGGWFYSSPAHAETSSPAKKTNQNVEYSKISINVIDTDLRDVLSALALAMNKNIVLVAESSKVTFKANDLYPAKALELLLESKELSYTQEGNLIVVGKKVKTEAQAPQAVQKKSVLSRFDLKYMPAKAFVNQLDNLALPIKKIYMDQNPKSFWGYGTPSDLCNVNEVLLALDIPENVSLSSEQAFTIIKLKYVYAQDVISVINQFGIQGKAFDLPISPKTLYISSTKQGMDQVSALVKKLDTSENSALEDSFTPIALSYINASDLQDAVTQMGLQAKFFQLDIKPKTLYVSASSSTMEQINELAQKLDVAENTRLDQSFNAIKLSYINASDIIPVISQLGLAAKFYDLKTSPKILYVASTRAALTDINSLVRKLDVPENSKFDSSITPINLNYINANDLIPLIGQLGIQAKVFSIDKNPKTVYVSGSKQDIAQINELIKKVDISGGSNGDQSFTTFKLNYVSGSDLATAITELGIPVKVVKFDSLPKLICLLGTKQGLDQVGELVKKLDLPEYSRNVEIVYYKFKNVVAKEAEVRLKALEFKDLNTITFSYPQFSYDMLIICDSQAKSQVFKYAASIDVAAQKLKVPVDFSNETNGQQKLSMRLQLLSTLCDIPANRFSISNDISRDSTPHFLLILEDTPDNIKKARDMVDSLDKP